MIKKLTISSLIITIILGVCALLSLPFAIKGQLSQWETTYGEYYNFETSKNVSVSGIKNLNLSSHQNHRIYGEVYQTNDKDIKIYYEGFIISKPQIIEQKDGETLNLQIDLEPVTEQQKNIISAYLSCSGYLKFRIYVPKDLNITLYCDNFTPIQTSIDTATQVMSANGRVYSEQYILTSDDYYTQLRHEYGINNGEPVSYMCVFEKFAYMMKNTFDKFNDGTLETPIFLGVKDNISNDILLSFKGFMDKNSDICSTPEAKDKIITCATTYINAQTRMSLILIEEDKWNDNIFDDYAKNNYSSNLESAVAQLSQCKDDLMQSMTTTMQTRKTEIVDMLTFI